MSLPVVRHFHSSTICTTRFTKEKIALAPNNPSAWNYLRGVLGHTGTPYASLSPFVKPYTATSVEKIDVVDLDNPVPSEGAELPCVMALEFLADTFEQEGGSQIPKAVEVSPQPHCMQTVGLM